MKEIKFRAWKKVGTQEMFRDIQAIDFKKGFVFIGYKVSELTIRTDKEKLENVELMQYTGLKDKNGVEIYFDDALTDGKMKRLVIWREDDSQIQLSVDDDEYENRIRLTQNMINTFGLIVCGNIYENPEILKTIS